MQSFKDQKEIIIKHKRTFYDKIKKFLRKTVTDVLSHNKTPLLIHRKLLLLAPLLWIVQKEVIMEIIRQDQALYMELQANYIATMTAIMVQNKPNILDRNNKNRIQENMQKHSIGSIKIDKNNRDIICRASRCSYWSREERNGTGKTEI